MGVAAFRSMRARLNRMGNRLKVALCYLSVTRYSQVRHRGEHVLTLSTRMALIVITYLLLCCTAIDILRQSFKSGQFWNAIIVIVAVAIIGLWTIGLGLVRRVEVNRWLYAIPRGHQIGQGDIGDKMMEKIIDARARCAYLFETQLDFSQIEHPGLQNPMKKHELNAADSHVETPYWEFMDTISVYLEDNFAVVVPELTIPKHSSLRDYIERAIAEHVLDTTNILPDVEKFLELYDYMRYSGKSLPYAELLEMMSSLVNIVEEIQHPEVVTNAHDDGGRYTPSMLGIPAVTRRPPSSRSSSCSSLASVRIYRTRESLASYRTFDSQVSVASHASVLSPFSRLLLRRTHSNTPAPGNTHANTNNSAR